jgi:mono/diheme cytochrome c family protein
MTRRSHWWWATALISLLGLFGLSPSGAAAPTGDAAITNPFFGRDDLVPEGRSLFNVHCAHCHGPNAFQGERPRDLRQLSRRYGEAMPAVFYKTATTGREDKGMPSWKNALKDEELWKIFTFLQTVQSR